MTRSTPLRSAAVIAVGSELLGSTRLDTNSLFVSERLCSLGIELRSKSVVGDSRTELAAHLRHALERVDAVVLTGGLGPTDDDVTREVVADVLGRPLEEDPAIVAHIQERFRRRGLTMPEVNRRQAQVPRGAVVLANPLGTAPGLLIEHERGVIVLLPGPPRELQPMLDGLVAGALAERASAERIYRTSLFVVGRSESHVEERVQPIYSSWLRAIPPIETTVLATPGQIELHLSVRTADPTLAADTLASARRQLREALAPDVYSEDGRPLEEIVGRLLQERGLTIAAAESCTGGLLLSRLTDVPGSSAYVLGGVVAYANELKTAFANVPADLIDRHGAVSEPVAAAMAEGIRERTGAAVGIGVTGVAGPGGGTPQKPVGMVVLAAVLPGAAARVRTVNLPGGRNQIKFNATQAALDLVRRGLLASA
ncbi:MAG TPA: competence/damage-inducible protein A [Vicinamibacterales bacterium]|nr:competence/damage-inducible protein A [Vicinamibacterales bacterium]